VIKFLIIYINYLILGYFIDTWGNVVIMAVDNFTKINFYCVSF